jgi:transposase
MFNAYSHAARPTGKFGCRFFAADLLQNWQISLRQFYMMGRAALIEGSAFDALIAEPLSIDEEMYKWRHLIENFFGRLKEFKRIAMRADKTDQRFASKSFTSMIQLTAAVINSR